MRVPEEDRGTEEVELDVSVDVPRAGILSPHIPVLCNMAATSTYASDRDIKLWATQRRGTAEKESAPVLWYLNLQV